MTKLVFICAYLLALQVRAAEILQIGNSHTAGFFGEALYRTLKEETGKSIYAVGAGGASATTYSSNSPKQRTLALAYVERNEDGKTTKVQNKPVTMGRLGDYIEDKKPSYIVIELGDNFANYKTTAKKPADKASDELVKNQVSQILNQLPKNLSATKCFWIGPTWTSQDGKNQYYKTNARAARVAELIAAQSKGKCEFIDSLKLLKQNEIVNVADGLHFDKVNGGKWGQTVAKEIAGRINSEIKPPPTAPAKNQGIK